MKLLVVGSGGREHALAWKLANDSTTPEIFCAPGNAGTSEVAVNVPIPAEDIAGLIAWCRNNKPGLVVVGPEVPLCDGLADELAANRIRVFGPVRSAAMLEGSKAFSKDLMKAAGVPTAGFKTFDNHADALRYIRAKGAPIIVKADGLAAGKGVFVCRSSDEAEKAVEEIMTARSFGDAGNNVVVEECLEGEEVSILALVDGVNFIPLASAQDHKRVFDGDKGPNTGGMGAYSPAPVATEGLMAEVREHVFSRTLSELRKRGIVFKGVLYAGIMVTPGGIRVLEFNCRFGDPETQAIIPRIDGDLLPALMSCVEGCLTEKTIRWKSQASICVVMASGGYPGPYERNKVIAGLKDAGAMKDVTVFHAGTAPKDGNVVTSGGRVLGVTALGADLPGAIASAYRAVSVISFEGAHYRKDIGARALSRLK